MSSSSLPEPSTSRTIGSLFDLAPGGVYIATTVTSSAVRSYRTISPLPTRGGILSVALAVSSRFPGVTWHPALWSPDFPLHFYSDCHTLFLPIEWYGIHIKKKAFMAILFFSPFA